MVFFNEGFPYKAAFAAKNAFSKYCENNCKYSLTPLLDSGVQCESIFVTIIVMASLPSN